MSPLLASLGLFAVAWLVHLAWWRTKPPRRQSAALVSLFLAVPVFAALGAALLGGIGLSAAEIPAVIALYAGAALSYLIIYTGVEQTSPSLMIVRTLACAQDRGCAIEELAQVMTDEILVGPRLHALALDGIVAPSDDGWVLTRRGYRAARIARLITRVFNVEDVA